MAFPKPYKLHGATRWRLSDILGYEAARLGRPAVELEPDEERYLSDKQLAERFGVTRGSIWRWAREGGNNE